MFLSTIYEEDADISKVNRKTNLYKQNPNGYLEMTQVISKYDTMGQIAFENNQLPQSKGEENTHKYTFNSH